MEHELMVVFADAGQGDCTLIFFPNGKIWMVDCGCKISNQVQEVVEESITGVIKRAYEEFFGSEPTSSIPIDLLILTHPDSDHINLVFPLIEEETVKFNAVMIGGKLETYGNSHEQRLFEIIQSYFYKLTLRTTTPGERERFFRETIQYYFQKRGRRLNIEEQNGIISESHAFFENYLNEGVPIDELVKFFLTELPIEGPIENEKLRNWLAAMKHDGRLYCDQQIEEYFQSLEPQEQNGVTLLSYNLGDRLENWEYDTYTGSHSNRNSITFLIEYQNHKFFFMGDATALVEEYILNEFNKDHPRNILKNPSGKTVLKLSHHGSHHSSISEWIQVINPDIVVVSSDIRSFAGRSLPRRGLLKRVYEDSEKLQKSSIQHHAIAYWDEENFGSSRRNELAVELTKSGICTTLYSLENNGFSGQPVNGVRYRSSQYIGATWWFKISADGVLYCVSDANPCRLDTQNERTLIFEEARGGYTYLTPDINNWSLVQEDPMGVSP